MPLPDLNAPGFNITNALVGTDLVFVPRLKIIERRHGDALFRKLLTPSEWAYCRSGGDKRRLIRVAARLAAKEATAKALGCGLNGLGWGQGVDWPEIEVLSSDRQPPCLQLHGKARMQAEKVGVRLWRLSLSHDGDYAMATVLALIVSPSL